ncbi:hypothetical protein GQX73_g9770 [Xylaria multiplex]|uniref:Peptidase S8/S53 domain-containing protein n=1 Tax=Xylaria multiplex TaxID=323545 RepID=A0A7C8IL56_9PEZI|nr:hypothetical protein GQX73_g9770 [Xylaria multiplex]
MSAADLESSALEAYHAAANGAQELIRHNVWDEGIEKWKRALDDVAPYITSEQLDLFKRHFDNFFQLRRDENAPSDDTGSDSSESQYGYEKQYTILSFNSARNDDWFSNLQKTTHNFVYGENREFWPAQPVRVAILDSGFALTGEAHKAMKPYWSRIKDKRTFTDEFPLPQTPLEKQKALDDPVGHGTTVAYQLMKTCPSAHVYIAKVTVAESDHKQAVPDKAAISRAIRYAAAPIAEGGWGVDVINMSFGWSESELPGTMEAAEGVSGAIELAEKKGVLLFAAASNYGLSQPNDVLYPARDSRIIPVDAEDGLGNPAPFALHSQRGSGGVRYCAPGLSVDSPVSAVQMCGSSFACPVAAGVAALVLEFARHQDVSLSKSESVKRALSSAKGMLKVFGPMSQQAVNHPGFNMLYPWFFLGNTQREEVALNIIRQLEIEFGKGNVGHEVVWTTTWQAVQNYSK